MMIREWARSTLLVCGDIEARVDDRKFCLLLSSEYGDSVVGLLQRGDSLVFQKASNATTGTAGDTGSRK